MATTGEVNTDIITDAICDRIRNDLRARILEKIEPDIQKSIDDVMNAIRIGIFKMRDDYRAEYVLKVLVTDRRGET